MSLVNNLAQDCQGSIPQASGGWAETKAAYRLLSNEALDWTEVLRAHGEPTLKRCEGQPVVLCIQDTTELDFSGQKGIAGLGRLNYDARYGLYLHPTLLVTPQGQALGVTDAWMWARAPRGEASVKESERWTEGYQRVAEMASENPGTRFVYVADRESDLRELMNEAARQDYPADFLLRAKHDRKLADEAIEKCWARVEKSRPLGEIDFILPAQEGRPSRPVKQTLYARRVRLAGKPSIEVTALLAREEDPPKGVKPIVWKFLTNRPVETQEQASELVDWYRCRWQIEILFHILKSGCRAEAMQLGTLERIERLLVIYLIIAWRILFLVTTGRECPDLPCDVAFALEEWQAAWIVAKRTPPPKTPPSLNELIRIVAGFGGFLGRKSDGEPGPKAIWTGMSKLYEHTVGILAMQQAFEYQNIGRSCG